MTTPTEVSNNLGLENVPDFQITGIGLMLATPESHRSDIDKGKQRMREGERSTLESQESYDFKTSPITVEEGSLAEGRCTGCDLEFCTPHSPPKVADIPTRPRLDRDTYSTSLRKVVHITDPSTSYASTRDESPTVFVVAANDSNPRSIYNSEPFKTHDPHNPRLPKRSPSTKWWKGKLTVTSWSNWPTLGWILVQAYKHLLFRLPSMYHSRVCQLFSDAKLSRPEMEQLINNNFNGDLYAEDWSPSSATPALKRFKHNWEIFVDQVMQEWKTLNVVSALLLSAILTVFQINGAASQPVVRTASLLALVFTIWSLIFGCAYIVRFASLRSVNRASTWAQEAENSEAFILWNVWVLLALPAVWLTWSVIAFLTAIMAFVWTFGSSSTPSALYLQRFGWASRAAVTAIFVLGFLYFALVVRTFSNYGSLREAGRQPEESDEASQENTSGPGPYLTSMPGRAIASPPSRNSNLAHDVLLATPEGSSKYSNFSPTASPRSPEVLLLSPRSLHVEKTYEDQQSDYLNA